MTRRSPSPLFVPIGIDQQRNTSRVHTGASAGPWLPSIAAAVAALPVGRSVPLRGIPFDLGSDDPHAPSWFVLPQGEPRRVEVPIGMAASFVVLAHFANTSQDPSVPGHHPGSTLGAVLRSGEHLADYVLRYTDGTEHRRPIRRRFEIQDAVTRWGFQAFACVPHGQDQPVDFHGPFGRDEWGVAQFRVAEGMAVPFSVYNEAPMGANLWLYALANPYPERGIEGLVVEATGNDSIAIAGVTAHTGSDDPLRYGRLITVDLGAHGPDDVPVSVDLGVVARRHRARPVPSEWQLADVKGWGEAHDPGSDPAAHQFVDVTAAADATLLVAGTAVSWRDVVASTEHPGRSRIRAVSDPRVRVGLTIRDGSTGAPTAARLHVRAADGRYLPPYGHSFEVNPNAWEDISTDCVLGATPYAYVDGSCLIEVPVGDIFIEVAKGFEHRPVRQRATVGPSTTRLDVVLDRTLDWRSRGWVSTDTHVHLVSPQTAALEGRAEGVDIVNLLAVQLGDEYLGMGDYTGGLSGVSTDEVLVWVGTENRNHWLGHLCLLGMTGSMPVPLSAGGPHESFLGDPVWATLSDWADAAHERGGLVVVGHYPVPYGEAFADAVLGKIDAVEILRDARGFPTAETTGVLTWYRLLNIGCRIPAVGGSDKVEAAMPIGAVRTYAHVGGGPLRYDAWMEAVRAGRTFATTGPLVELRVDGHMPGDRIRLGPGGADLTVECVVAAHEPFANVEVIRNGYVVHRVEPVGDGRSLSFTVDVSCPETSWIALRVWGPHQKQYAFPLNTVAHTSPIYVDVDGSTLFDADAARHMLTNIDGVLVWLDTLAVQVDPVVHARNRAVIADARARLVARMEQRSVGA